MKYAAIYGTSVGVLIILQWIFFLAIGSVPELQTASQEIGFRISAELLLAAALLIADIAMHSLGIGTTHDMKSVVSGLLLPSLQFREYTLSEKINLWRGKSQSGVSSMWEEMIATNLSKQLTELDIPVYFFHSIYDYTCSCTEAKSYFGQLNAPLKGFTCLRSRPTARCLKNLKKCRRFCRGM